MFCMLMFVCACLLASLHIAAGSTAVTHSAAKQMFFVLRCLFLLCCVVLCVRLDCVFDLENFVAGGRGSFDILPLQSASLFSGAVVPLLCLRRLLVGVTHMNRMCGFECIVNAASVTNKSWGG